MLDSELRHLTGEPLSIRGYGCVQCQTHHFEGDAEFEPHLWRQSKHGIQRYPPSVVADARARRAREEAP